MNKWLCRVPGVSVYAPGAPGFVPHTDHCGPSDLRRITAVYYPNAGEWPAGDGGQLVLWPKETGSGGGGGGGRRREIAPVGDRLVVGSGLGFVRQLHVAVVVPFPFLKCGVFVREHSTVSFFVHRRF